MEVRNHISVSQIKMFLRCPLQYKFRYIDGLKISPTSSLTLGKSIHSALESNYSQKITSKQDLPGEKILDLFSDRWEKEAVETLFSEDEKAGMVKDDGVKMVRAYHDQISPTIQPRLVEHEFNLSFENVDYTLKGIIDLVDVEGRIIDHKTAKRSMAPDDVAADIQLTCYALAYRSLFGAPEKELRFDVMVRTKVPKLQQIPTTRTQEDIQRFLKIVGFVSKAIQSGIFYPCGNRQVCSWCGYYGLCEKW
jgi:putative RecB family exonuclease